MSSLERPRHAVRDENLYQILHAHSEREDKTLQGVTEDHTAEFTSARMDCIDCHKMPRGNQIINVVRHPRFEYIPKHRHNYIEACYVCSGSLTHIINEKEICLETGDLLMMNQYTSHEILPAGEDDVAVNFIIQSRFFDDTYELAAKSNVLSDFIVDLLRQEVNYNQYLHYKTLMHLPISDLLEILLSNFFPYDDGVSPRQNTNSTDDELNKALMFLAFRYLSRELSDLNVDAPMNYEEIMMTTVRKYIDTSYQSATLTELAEIMNQSASALSRQIKAISGSTFKELLQNRRFQRAIRLLEETNLSVSDIALAVGYENSSYFYRRFREIYGISPKAYRENTRSQHGK